MSTTSVYTTSIPAAAFVVASGCAQPRLESIAPGHFNMHFAEANAGELLASYFSGGAVPAPVQLGEFEFFLSDENIGAFAE